MEQRFKIRSAKQFATKLSARIQKSGKLGFGENAGELMNLTEGVYIAFFSDSENVAVTHLVVRRTKDDDSFELKKGGTKYPCVEAKQLFDFFSIDYQNPNKSVFFDLTRDDTLDEELNGEVYRVIERIKERNNSTDKDNEDEDITD